MLVDFGRELYVPWQLSEGRTLYTDIVYFNGPLSPYVNSLWFRALGVSIRSLAIGNAIVLAGVICLTYWLLSAIGSRFAAFMGTWILVLVFGFGHHFANGNFNFIYPYSHEATHGMALSLAALACCWQFLMRRRLLWLAASGLLAGLAFLTKPEIFLALAAALVASLTLASLPFRGVRPLVELWTALVAPLVVVPLVAWGLLSLAMPARLALRGTLGGWLYLANSQLIGQTYYRKLMGTFAAGESLLIVARWLGIYALLIALAWLLALWTPTRRGWTEILALGAFAGTAAVSVMFRGALFSDGLVPLPFFMVAAGCLVAVRNLRNGSEPAGQTITALAAIVFALVLLLKILLKTQAAHYGFALALPATMILIIIMLDWIPAAIERRGGHAAIFRAAWLGAMAVFVGASLEVDHHMFALKTVLVGTGGDAIGALPMYGDAVDAVLGDIARSVKPRETIVVLPEGVMINYLARRDSSIPYTNVLPPELIMFGEDAILAALADHPPDYVALVPSNLSEFGYHSFGDDFALKIWDWLQANYQPTAPIPQDDAIHIPLLVRKREK